MSRVCLIGIDGADFKVINKLDLPNIKRLMKEGCSSILKSTIPPFSPIAWNSMFTGAKPHEHNIYGFVQLKPNSYDYTLVNSKTRRVKALWNEFQGVYLNIPFAYPAEKIDGVLIPGLGSPDEDYGEAKFDLRSKKFRDHAFHILKGEIKTAKKYFKTDWRLFVNVFRLTDILQHYYWDNLAVLEKAYKRIDNFIGWVLENKQPDDILMITSDHGFCHADTVFCVNTWLSQKGYLHQPLASSEKLSKIINLIRKSPLRKIALFLLSRPPFNRYLKHLPTSGFDLLKTINEKTIAYYVPGSCTSITINLKGRQPKGAITTKDYKRTVNKIIRDLKKLEIIKKVYKATDLYGTTDIKRLMFDIVFSLKEGYTFRSHDKDNKILKPLDTGVNGTHTEDGIFISNKKQPIKSIYDVSSYIHKLLK